MCYGDQAKDGCWGAEPPHHGRLEVKHRPEAFEDLFARHCDALSMPRSGEGK
jgi:hypothetical protein